MIQNIRVHNVYVPLSIFWNNELQRSIKFVHIINHKK